MRASEHHDRDDDDRPNGYTGRIPAQASSLGGTEDPIAGDIQPGQSFKFTFSVPGQYRYFCVPHEIFGMVGEIEVEQ